MSCEYLTMSSFANPSLFHVTQKRGLRRHLPIIRSSLAGEDNIPTQRRSILTTFLATSLAVLSGEAQPAVAQNWGTRSFLKERFFEPGLSSEDAVARIRQTAEGLHSIREMLENRSWRYVIFYIRLKQSYLSQDMKNAINLVPQSQRKSYVEAANDLVENMSELDYYVRTPKIYESYLYYEKTLKSIDHLVTFLV